MWFSHSLPKTGLLKLIHDSCWSTDEQKSSWQCDMLINNIIFELSPDLFYVIFLGWFSPHCEKAETQNLLCNSVSLFFLFCFISELIIVKIHPHSWCSLCVHMNGTLGLVLIFTENLIILWETSACMITVRYKGAQMYIRSAVSSVRKEYEASGKCSDYDWSIQSLPMYYLACLNQFLLLTGVG